MIISDSVREKADMEYGSCFSSLSKIDSKKITDDTLSLDKPVNEIEILTRYLPNRNVTGLKLLNVGSGFGVFNLVAIKKYNMDAYGLEPDGEGFGNSYEISKQIFVENDLPVSRLFAGVGENIPFEDNYFDIVYSTNVLEHVQDPLKVFDEGLRVLKPGGILQYVFPSYHSFFDGHYAVFHPPVLFRSFFPWYIRHIVQRDAAYAKTLNVEINARWAQKATNLLGKKYAIELLSLGEDVFLERISGVKFGEWAGLYKVKKILDLLQKLHLNLLLGKFMYISKTWSPVILTVKKLS